MSTATSAAAMAKRVLMSALVGVPAGAVLVLPATTVPAKQVGVVSDVPLAPRRRAVVADLLAPERRTGRRRGRDAFGAPSAGDVQHQAAPVVRPQSSVAVTARRRGPTGRSAATPPRIGA